MSTLCRLSLCVCVCVCLVVVSLQPDLTSLVSMAIGLAMGYLHCFAGSVFYCEVSCIRGYIGFDNDLFWFFLDAVQFWVVWIHALVDEYICFYVCLVTYFYTCVCVIGVHEGLYCVMPCRYE